MLLDLAAEYAGLVQGLTLCTITAFTATICTRKATR